MTMFEQTILPLFEEHRGDWLTAARSIAAQMGADGRAVTIDDVRDRIKPPANVDPRVMGSVLTRKDWVLIGYQQSTRASCHHRPIGVFKLRSALA